MCSFGCVCWTINAILYVDYDVVVTGFIDTLGSLYQGVVGVDTKLVYQ